MPKAMEYLVFDTQHYFRLWSYRIIGSSFEARSPFKVSCSWKKKRLHAEAVKRSNYGFTEIGVQLVGNYVFRKSEAKR